METFIFSSLQQVLLTVLRVDFKIELSKMSILFTSCSFSLHHVNVPVFHIVNSFVPLCSKILEGCICLRSLNVLKYLKICVYLLLHFDM